MSPPAREGRLLLVIDEGSSHPLELAPGTNRLPTGAMLQVEGDQIELSAGRARVTINDVEVRGPALLHPGDVLAEGGAEYLLLPRSRYSSERRPRLLDHVAWQARVEEEASSATSGFGVLLGRSGAFTPDFLSTALADDVSMPQVRTVWGTFDGGTLEILVLGEAPDVESVRQLVSDRAAREDETVRWGTSRFPTHGATAEELWSVAVDRLLGLEAIEASMLVWMDPCMTRLRAFADRWGRRHALAMIGAEGVGRESLARAIRAVGEPAAPFIVHRGARFDSGRWSEDIARASGGALHVRRPEILPPHILRAFWEATAFRPSVGSSILVPRNLANRILIPDLAARPLDVGSIAEQVVHSVDAQLGRRRSSLRTESRALLQELPAPENVRTLRNLVIRGALNSGEAEVRPEHFGLGAARSAQRGVRAKMRETEREEIEAALRRSGWNVTDAAEQMKLPRRTLVYRMARLGLRRPKQAR